MFQSSMKKAEKIDPKEEKRKKRAAYLSEVFSDFDKYAMPEKTKEQINWLSAEANRLSALATEESSSVKVTEFCNNVIKEIYDLLKEDKIDTSKVISKLSVVKQRLIRAYDSKFYLPTWFPWITVYNVVLLVGFVFTIAWVKLIPGQAILGNSAYVCLACAIWGGIGSVVDAFLALNTHTANRDFDPQYWPWYYYHPLLGFTFGAMIYLLMTAGLLAVGGSSLQDTSANTTLVTIPKTISQNITAISNTPATAGQVGLTALPIALALLAGYRQTAIINLLRRLIDAVFPKGSNDEA